MKTIVLFTSNTGFTKQYANWLANDLSCPWIDLSKTKWVDLDEYDMIAFGSWLMAGKIKKGKQLKSLLKQYQEKNWIVFCVGRTPLDQIDFKSLIHQNFEEDLPSSVSFFYLPGGFETLLFSTSFLFAPQCFDRIFFACHAGRNQSGEHRQC